MCYCLISLLVVINERMYHVRGKEQVSSFSERLPEKVKGGHSRKKTGGLQ